jgi:hypothetical protein
VRLSPSTDPAVTSVGFFVTALPFPGKWAANDYTSNDYCVASNLSAEKTADHFSWVDSIGSGLDAQPWRLSGSATNGGTFLFRDMTRSLGRRFSQTCQNK